jgi:hypothetical protein
MAKILGLAKVEFVLVFNGDGPSAVAEDFSVALSVKHVGYEAADRRLHCGSSRTDLYKISPRSNLICSWQLHSLDV